MHDDPARTDFDPFGAPLVRGAWQVRLATVKDRDAVMRLRARAFRGDADADDRDAFDAQSLHLWVGQAGQGPDTTLRLRLHPQPDDVLSGYAAQYYDLTALARAPGPVLELGRLCRRQGRLMAKADPRTRASARTGAEAMRLLWAGVARVALRTGAARLIGCTSFYTTDPAQLMPLLALLGARYGGPPGLRPAIKARETLTLANIAPSDPGTLKNLPPLLRNYLMLGGWVSDHMVIDHDLGTSHVFTCVEIATMPAARKRVLTAMAAQ